MRTLTTLMVVSLFWGTTVNADVTEVPLNNYGYFSAGGALFGYYNPEGSTGSGVFQPFLRFTPDGYNSDAKEKDLEYGTFGGVHTHSIQLSAIPVVKVKEVYYLQFLLDANQSQKSFLDRWLSIDEVVISLQTDPALTGYEGESPGFPGDVGDDGQHVFSLGNYAVIFDSDVYNAGSGDGDLEMLIPTSLLPPETNPSLYLYLWTRTGVTENPEAFTFLGDWEKDYTNTSITVKAGSTASYEEWGVQGVSRAPEVPVPVPGALLLVGMGSVAIGYFRNRRYI